MTTRSMTHARGCCERRSAAADRRTVLGIAGLVGVAGLLSSLPFAPAFANGHCPGEEAAGDDYGWARCWYTGLGYGYSYVSPDGETQNFVPDASENHSDGLQLFVGKQFTRRWFAELKFADLGEAGLVNRDPAIEMAFPDAAISYQVPSLMAGYRWRVDESLMPFAKLGLAAIANSSEGAPAPFEEQTNVQIAIGAGVEYGFGERWFLRGDIDWYDREAWYSGLSIGRSFGAAGPQREAPAPAAPASDGDADGVPDSADRCPESARGSRVGRDGCPIISDADGDGVEDARDRCAGTLLGALVDQRGCEPDADGDGIADGRDRCPATARGAAVDANGCVRAPDIRLPVVRFDYKSDQLTAESVSALDEAAAVLAGRRDLLVEVGGHTDDVGGQRYNLGLSAERANQVLEYLVSRGVDRAQLRAKGYGQSEPVASNTTDAGRAQNRRVELRIVGQ